jgi:hypothetical protein
MLMSNCGNYSILISEVKDKLEEFIQENNKENIYKLFDKLYAVYKFILNSIESQKRK